MAKVGLDGHDRGIKVVARMLRDAGMEVIYGGLRQTPDGIAAAALDEDVDAVGLSMHNGAHLTLAPAVVQSLSAAGVDVPVIVGGVVPEIDVDAMHRAGVAAILGPGASPEAVVEAVASAVRSSRAKRADPGGRLTPSL
ncbi:MAG: cobalamin-dependent protein [Acidimicrobiales bacterium]